MSTWNLANWAIRLKRTAKPETCCWCKEPILPDTHRRVDSKQVRHAHPACHRKAIRERKENWYGWSRL